MQVSDEEILHIAKLANLNLNEQEIEKYKKDLQDILSFANIVNNAKLDGLTETICANEACNVFRKDEIIESLKIEELLQNAEEEQQGMFKIPKVIN